MTNDEGGTDNEEFRTAAVIDRVNTTWEALMGTSFACVQCHDHPYDPFRHDEYYQFMAFFNNSRDADTEEDYPLLRHFAIQTGAWGAIDCILALAARPSLSLRDYDGVTSLDRFLWFNCGLDVGYIAVGITLALCGWRLAKSRGLVGAGLGVGIQGAALLLLDLRLAALLSQAR